MRFLSKKTQLKNSFLVFSTLFFVIVLLAILYWLEIVVDPKWVAIISGLLTGFVVAAFQTWLSWEELKKMDEYDALKIIKILPRRDDREHYEKLMSGAKEKILLEGITAHRFLDHFASEQKNAREGAKVLLYALTNGVEVKILVASPSVLPDEKSQHKAKLAEVRLKELKQQYGSFDYAYFDHEPAHVILTVDGESIVGPVFTGVSSEVTPAIHLHNDSEFVKQYLEYFKREWEKWGSPNAAQ